MLDNIGATYGRLGQYEQAIAYYEEAMLLSRAIGDRAGESSNRNNIGTLHLQIGQEQQAIEYFQQALLIVQDIGDHDGEAITLDNIGMVYLLSSPILLMLLSSAWTPSP